MAGRSCGEAARLRELAPGFAEGASLRLRQTGRIHSATLRASPPPTRLPETVGRSNARSAMRCVVRRFAADVSALACDLTARSCRQVLDGSAACEPRDGSRGFGCGTGCAFSRTRPVLAQSCGFTARPTGHRDASLGYFSVRQKSDSLAGRREKRLTRRATAKQEDSARLPGETLDQIGDSRTDRSGSRTIPPKQFRGSLATAKQNVGTSPTVAARPLNAGLPESRQRTDGHNRRTRCSNLFRLHP